MGYIQELGHATAPARQSQVAYARVMPTNTSAVEEWYHAALPHLDPLSAADQELRGSPARTVIAVGGQLASAAAAAIVWMEMNPCPEPALGRLVQSMAGDYQEVGRLVAGAESATGAEVDTALVPRVDQLRQHLRATAAEVRSWDPAA